jgi:hypothetical protein
LQWKMLVYVLYLHLVYLTAIWCILWTFGISDGHLVYFPPFWYLVAIKIWQPCRGRGGCGLFLLQHSFKKFLAGFFKANFTWSPPWHL